jgi:hypothetical protein
LENKIRDRINGYTDKQQIRMEIIQGRQEATAEMIALAESLGISVGKLKLVQMAMEFDETLTLEVGATMAVKDLNAIVKTHRQEMKEFIGEQLRNKYFEFRQEARGTFAVNRIQFIYDAMIIASDDVFTTILEGTTATPADIKTLYEQYLNAVKAIEVPEPVETEAVEEEVTTEVALDTEFEELLTQRRTKMVEMVQLKSQLSKAKKGSAQYEEVRTQLQIKWQEVQTLNEQIQADKQQYRNEFAGTHEGYKFGISETNNTVEVQAQFDWINIFREVRIEYEAKFLEIGIDLTTLEQLFHEIVEPQMAEIRTQYQADLGTLKDEIKAEADALREQYRSNKDTTRGMWGK